MGGPRAIIRAYVDKSGQHIKKQRHHFADKGPYGQSYGFFRSHIRMWELYHKEGWTPKYWCFWIVVETTLESPWEYKEIKPVNPKGNQSEYSLEGLILKLKLQYLATWYEKPTHWKRPWCWVRLKAGEEGSNRGGNGWLASLTRWTWVWTSSRR